MYYIVGDITCFHGCDRWGKDAVRIIGTAKTYLGAIWKAKRHVADHVHGQAWITKDKPDVPYAPLCDRL